MSDWKDHFERTGTRTSKCRLCGFDLDHAGGRPQRHLREKHPEVPQEPATEEPSPEEPKSPQQVREETLGLATQLLKDPTTPANARVAAARLISDIEGLQDMGQEEDEGEAEQKVVERFQRAIQKKSDLEEEFRIALRDPATLARVERLCAEVRATL